MGLSEEDKKRIQYFRDMEIKEELERLEKEMKSPEYVRVLEKFNNSFEDHLYQRLVTYFRSIELKEPTVELVVSTTFYFTQKICNDTMYARPLLAEKMLERFNLVKKKKSE